MATSFKISEKVERYDHLQFNTYCMVQACKSYIGLEASFTLLISTLMFAMVTTLKIGKDLYTCDYSIHD